MSKCSIGFCNYDKAMGCNELCVYHHRAYQFGLIDTNGNLLCELVDTNRYCQFPSCDLHPMVFGDMCFRHQFDEIISVQINFYKHLERVSRGKFYNIEKKYLSGKITLKEFEEYAYKTFIRTYASTSNKTKGHELLFRRDLISYEV